MEKKICVYSFKKPNTFGKFVRLNGEVIKPCKYKFWALFLCFLLDFYSPADSLAGALGHTDPQLLPGSREGLVSSAAFLRPCCCLPVIPVPRISEILGLFLVLQLLASPRWFSNESSLLCISSNALVFLIREISQGKSGIDYIKC